MQGKKEMDAAKDAILSWINAFFPPGATAATFESLTDAHHFYRLLAIAASYAFTEDLDSTMLRTDNWILKKTNLSNLVRDMNRFGSVFLKAPNGFDLLSDSGGGGGEGSIESLDAIAKGEDNDKGLVTLAEYVVTMAALSGNSSVIEKLRHLSKERQVVLNATMKKVMTRHGFKKAVPPTTAASAQNQINNAAAAAAASPTAPVVGAPSASASATAGSSSNTNNSNARGGLFGGGGHGGGGGGQEDEDISVLRGELNVLRNELRDKSSALDTAESKCSVAEQQLEQLQARYRTLLEESESRGETAKERELQKALTAISRKDDQISQLGGMVSDLELKIKTLKQEAREAADEVERAKQSLEAEKKRIAALIEERSQAIAEKSEVLNKLQTTEDRLKIVMNKRDEFEKELMRREAEDHNATREAISNAGTAALIASLSSAIGVEGIASTADVVTHIKSLTSKLALREQELGQLKGLNTNVNTSGFLGNGSGDRTADDDNLSNTSITQAAGQSIGETGFNNNTSVVSGDGGSSPKTQRAPSVEQITNNNNTHTAADIEAAVAAATAALKAESDAALATLQQRLSEAQSSMKSLDEKLAEQRDVYESSIESFKMKIKQARDDALEEANKDRTSGAAGLQKEMADLQLENERIRAKLNEITNEMASQDEQHRDLLARQEQEFRTRFEAGRKAMREEQAVVTSVVFHCGQRSLALQQRNLLGGAAVPHAYKDEGFSALFRAAANPRGGNKGGSNGRGGVSDEEMAVATGEAESFMSSARLAGLWGTMKTGGAAPHATSSIPVGRK